MLVLLTFHCWSYSLSLLELLTFAAGASATLLCSCSLLLLLFAPAPIVKSYFFDGKPLFPQMAQVNPSLMWSIGRAASFC